MEATENPKIVLTDIRQSTGWAEYLSTLGWKSVRTSGNINVELKKIPFGRIVKIQRPNDMGLNDLEEIEQICVKEKALFIKIEPSLSQNLDVLESRGYETSGSPLLPPSTIFIDLKKDEATLWNTISHSGKYSVNRARREETVIKFVKNPTVEDLKKFHDIEKITGNRKRFYVQSFEDLQTKVRVFPNESYLILAYDKNENLAGGGFYLGFNKNVWFIHGATSEIGRKGKSGYLLFWEAFLYFKSLGYKILDLEGKDDKRFPLFTKDWGGFSHFKERFGGLEIVYPSPYIKMLNPAFRFLAKFRGNLL